MYNLFSDHALAAFKESSNLTELGSTRRDLHQDLVSKYIDANFSDLKAIGISATDMAIVKEVCKNHRFYSLSTIRSDVVRKVAGLLRICDEMDIGSTRAPYAYFKENYEQMDPLARNHWVKHMITQDWTKGHNVRFDYNMQQVTFIPAFNLPDIKYGLFVSQLTTAPINRELMAVGDIIRSLWGIDVKVEDTLNHMYCQLSYGDCNDIVLFTLDTMYNEDSLSVASVKKKPAKIMSFYRASDDTRCNTKTMRSTNIIGKALATKFETEFRQVPAKKCLSAKLKTIWTAPSGHDAFSFHKHSLEASSLDIPVLPLFERINSDTSETVLANVSAEFVNRTLKTDISNDYLVIFGDRGCGKTVTLNAIFTVNRDIFRHNKIFWLRTSLIHDVGVNATKWTENNIMYSIACKFINILNDIENKYYDEFVESNVLDYYKSEYIRDSSINTKEHIWNELVSQFVNYPIPSFEKAVRMMHRAGYRFIFIYDNLDQIEAMIDEQDFIINANSKQLEDGILNTLNVAVLKRYIDTPSLNIIVARGETVNKYLPTMIDTRLLDNRSLRAIGVVNKEEVLSNRLKYMILPLN